MKQECFILDERTSNEKRVFENIGDLIGFFNGRENGVEVNEVKPNGRT